MSELLLGLYLGGLVFGFILNLDVEADFDLLLARSVFWPVIILVSFIKGCIKLARLSYSSIGKC